MQKKEQTDKKNARVIEYLIKDSRNRGKAQWKFANLGTTGQKLTFDQKRFYAQFHFAEQHR